MNAAQISTTNALGAFLAVVAGHHGSDRVPLLFRQPEEPVAERELACNARARVALRTGRVAVLRENGAPEGDYCVGISTGNGTNDHFT